MSQIFRLNPGPPPGGGGFNQTIHLPPPLSSGGSEEGSPAPSEPCECDSLSSQWGDSQSDFLLASADELWPSFVFAANGSICPDTSWTADVTWDGDEGEVPTLEQLGAATWKVTWSGLGTYTVLIHADCGSNSDIPLTTLTLVIVP